MNVIGFFGKEKVTNEKEVFIPWNRVTYIHSNNKVLSNTSIIKTSENKEVIIKATLKEIETKMKGAFVRCNRETLVNLNYLIGRHKPNLIEVANRKIRITGAYKIELSFLFKNEIIENNHHIIKNI